MNRTYERYLSDPGFRSSLVEAARRERAKSVGSFFASLFHSRSSGKRRPHGSQFARQG